MRYPPDGYGCSSSTTGIRRLILAASGDALVSSAIEGLVVPPILPEACLPPEHVPVSGHSCFPHLPVLTSALFHPPVSLHPPAARPAAL